MGRIGSGYGLVSVFKKKFFRILSYAAAEKGGYDLKGGLIEKTRDATHKTRSRGIDRESARSGGQLPPFFSNGVNECCLTQIFMHKTNFTAQRSVCALMKSSKN